MQGTSKITPSKLVLREKLFGSELTTQLILQSASTFFRAAHVAFQQPTRALWHGRPHAAPCGSDRAFGTVGRMAFFLKRPPVDMTCANRSGCTQRSCCFAMMNRTRDTPEIQHLGRRPSSSATWNCVVAVHAALLPRSRHSVPFCHEDASDSTGIDL